MKQAQTKIVATLGPASSGRDNIAALAKAGVNVFRMNFSHGTHKDHAENYKAIRAVAKANKTHYSVLADMQGPKLRVGNFENGKVLLKKGQKFTLDMDETLGNETRVALMHPEIFAVLEKGMILLLNDGQIQLRVNDYGKDYMHTTVLVGGTLSNHKGVNIPDVVLPISALTKKDKDDLAFALKMGADWICLSFVQQPKDVEMARKLIGDKAGIIVKVEKPAALKHLAEIIDLSDGIMVARGDLGVECPLETVPTTQHKIVHMCRQAGKPVIVATQMLESMINSPVPTRAEVSDVATAVYEGADAVMLSAETAAGNFPIEAVTMMHKIIMCVQNDPYYHKLMAIPARESGNSITNAIAGSMKQVVSTLDTLKCIATFSVSGRTTLRIARERCLVPILTITDNEKTANRLSLVWGVQPVVSKHLEEMDKIVPAAVKFATNLGLAQKGDDVLVTAGIPFARHGTTNILHVATVD